MTHRTETAAVGIDWDKERIAETFVQSGYTRLPVFKSDLDDIVGILHYKDFFTPSGISASRVEDLMKPAVFVNASEKIDDVLRVMKKHKTHLCIVVDEYGGTTGLVTMEDILEELVGEIWDEHDEEREDIIPQGENAYIADGSMNLNEFSGYFGIETESDNVSLGGWVTEILGRIPEKGDSFEYGPLGIEVVKTDSHRVVQVKVTKAPKETLEQ